MKHTYLQILDPIKEKHGDQLNPELISLKIVQSKEDCWVHSEYFLAMCFDRLIRKDVY